MLVDSILNTKSPKFLTIEPNITNSAELYEKVDKSVSYHVNIGCFCFREVIAINIYFKTKDPACKIMMTLFRYSGSVYHMAIFSEAIYLVLLLKFPYYSELKGCKFCIFISWSKLTIILD
jgi:hypothetical protein